MSQLPVITVRLTNGLLKPLSRDDVTLRNQDAVVAPVQGPAAPKSLSVVSPEVLDQFTMFFTTKKITISEIISVVEGTDPSTNFTVKFSPDRSAAGTEVVGDGITCNNTTTGLITTTINNPIIPKDNFIWIVINTVSGTVDQLHVTLDFN